MSLCDTINEELDKSFEKFNDEIKYEKIEYITSTMYTFIGTIHNRYKSFGKDLNKTFEEFIYEYSGTIFDELLNENYVYRFGKSSIYFDIIYLLLIKYWKYGNILKKWYNDKCTFKKDTLINSLFTKEND